MIKKIFKNKFTLLVGSAITIGATTTLLFLKIKSNKKGAHSKEQHNCKDEEQIDVDNQDQLNSQEINIQNSRVANSHKPSQHSISYSKHSRLSSNKKEDEKVDFIDTLKTPSRSRGRSEMSFSSSKEINDRVAFEKMKASGALNTQCFDLTNLEQGEFQIREEEYFETPRSSDHKNKDSLSFELKEESVDCEEVVYTPHVEHSQKEFINPQIHSVAEWEEQIYKPQKKPFFYDKSTHVNGVSSDNLDEWNEVVYTPMSSAPFEFKNEKPIQPSINNEMEWAESRQPKQELVSAEPNEFALPIEPTEQNQMEWAESRQPKQEHVKASPIDYTSPIIPDEANEDEWTESRNPKEEHVTLEPKEFVSPIEPNIKNELEWEETRASDKNLIKKKSEIISKNPELNFHSEQFSTPQKEQVPMTASGIHFSSISKMMISNNKIIRDVSSTILDKTIKSMTTNLFEKFISDEKILSSVVESIFDSFLSKIVKDFDSDCITEEKLIEDFNIAPGRISMIEEWEEVFQPLPSPKVKKNRGGKNIPEFRVSQEKVFEIEKNPFLRLDAAGLAVSRTSLGGSIVESSTGKMKVKDSHIINEVFEKYFRKLTKSVVRNLIQSSIDEESILIQLGNDVMDELLSNMILQIIDDSEKELRDNEPFDEMDNEMEDEELVDENIDLRSSQKLNFLRSSITPKKPNIVEGQFSTPKEPKRNSISKFTLHSGHTSNSHIFAKGKPSPKKKYVNFSGQH